MNGLTILLANDKVLYNHRYRTYLMAELDKIYGAQVVSVGTLESLGGIIYFACRSNLNTLVVSSNLKTNLISLMLFCRGVLILNGLGRHQKSLLFRKLFLLGVTLNKSRKTFFVQRYRDFRWLRRYVRGINIEWMPGSGAEPLPVTDVSESGTYVVISRPEKLRVIEAQLRRAVADLGIQELLIYGVSSGYQFSVQPGCEARFMGYVEPKDFFQRCRNLLQVDGYGEGFPHTLAYALCSPVKVAIDKRLSTSLGMYRLPVNRARLSSGYEVLKLKPELADMLSSATVYQRVLEEVKRLIEARAF